MPRKQGQWLSSKFRLRVVAVRKTCDGRKRRSQACLFDCSGQELSGQSELTHFASIVSYSAGDPAKPTHFFVKFGGPRLAIYVPCQIEMYDSMTTAVWYEASNVCALADAERHLGHAVRASQGWVAYDGTHSDAATEGFKELGTFGNIAEAKIAIEYSLGFCQRPSRSERVWAPYSGWATPGNEVYDNVSEMPLYEIDDQTRHRD